MTRLLNTTGNCPKYLNKKKIIPALPDPKLITDHPQLPPAAVELLNRADCLLVASIHGTEDMDVNIRGGPPGFVRLASNGPSGSVLVYPEYSGNRLYQTLGNFQTTPLAGYVFPDFDTGNALYATGRTEVLIGKDAAALLPRSNLAIKVTVTSARYVEKSLAFRGIAGAPSPYNPSVRYLATERVNRIAQLSDDVSVTATMVAKEILTPSIGRFRFRISDPSKMGTWAPGQYATFSFQEELDMGYCHMQDDDPLSLNDDYVRTFTISSHPGHGLPANEFEITVRKHGNVTSHLFRTSERAGLEVHLKSFGGEFKLDDQGGDCTIPVIAGGIGITPVIAQLPGIDASRLHLLWSISMTDVGLVFDTFKRFPQLPGSTTLFLTGSEPKDERGSQQLEAVISSGARIERRRMEARDLDTSLGNTWYFCGSPALKGSVMTWLAGKRVIYEDFTY
jgi:ferredoxin-NADP reductase